MIYQLNTFETLDEEPKFSIFVKALTMTGLMERLRQPIPLTVLAPSNLSFTRLPEARLVAMLEPANCQNLAEVMKYHIIEGKWMSESIARRKSLISLQNQSLRIEAANFGFKVNGANLQSRNIETANGVIHGIDTVLFPAIATQTIRLSDEALTALANSG